MRRLIDTAQRVAAADSSLLILGETGVGKEWLARAIHAEGARASAPFIAVNCAAIPDTLLESELFGHERGSFTGAVSTRRGHFELAHRGTIFLDEIGDMSPMLQAKLLRVLQERAFQRVGSERLEAVDVRLMAATHRDLESGMEDGSFRRDLYYRLSVVSVTIPPLRNRCEDIPLLALAYLQHFLVRVPRARAMPLAAELPEDVLHALIAYDWPGNVRELINVMERAVLLAQGPQLTLDDFPESIVRCAGSASVPAAGAAAAGDAAAWLERPWRVARDEAMAGFERQYFAAQLAATGGSIAATAVRAGIDPRSLYEKMRRLGLRKEEFKSLAPLPSKGSARAAAGSRRG